MKKPPPPTGWTENVIVPLVEIPEALCPHCGGKIVLAKPRPKPHLPPEVTPISKK